MGLPDEYQDEIIDGKISGEAYPDWKTNIMGELTGSVEQRSINMIINFNFTKENLKGCGCL